MNTLVSNARAKNVRLSEQTMTVVFADGRELTVPLAYFPRLLRATDIQRKEFVISGGGTGLHWEKIDEDISIENLLLGFGDTTRQFTSTKKEVAA